MPTPVAGHRYLLIPSQYSNGEEPIIAQDILPGSTVWGDVVAYENDIIEYNGVGWVVVFDSREAASPQYVKNIANGQHYKFNGNTWLYSYLGVYNPGYWRIAF